MEDQHDGRDFNEDHGYEDGDGEIELSGSGERTMRDGDKAYAESGNENTSENQSLG